MKREGWFALRYSIFHIYGRTRGHEQIRVLATCDGGPFEIFSTKRFPGLQASTDLTKVRELPVFP